MHFTVLAQGQPGVHQLVVIFLLRSVGKFIGHAVGPDEVAVAVFRLDQVPAHGKLVVIFQLVAAFLHEIVEAVPGVVGVGDAGEDGELVVVTEVLEFHAPQQKAETGAIVSFLHGLHGGEYRIRGKRLVGGFQG